MLTKENLNFKDFKHIMSKEFIYYSITDFQVSICIHHKYNSSRSMGQCGLETWQNFSLLYLFSVYCRVKTT